MPELSEHSDKFLPLFRKGGFHSETISTLNIGRLTSKQWFGEESILLGRENYIFTVVAATQVIVYEIQKNDIPKLFPEIKQTLLQNSKSKLAWMEERKKELTNTFTTILFLDQEKKPQEVVEAITAQTEEIHNIVDTYPQATTYTLEKIQARKALREHLKSADMTKRRQPMIEPDAPLSPNISSLKSGTSSALPSRPRTAVTSHSHRASLTILRTPTGKKETLFTQSDKPLTLSSPTTSDINQIKIPLSSIKQKSTLDLVGEESSVEETPAAKISPPKRKENRYLSLFKRNTSAKGLRKQKSTEYTPLSYAGTPKFDLPQGFSPINKARSPKGDKKTMTFSSVDAIIEKINTPKNTKGILYIKTEESAGLLTTEPNMPKTVRDTPVSKKKKGGFQSMDFRAIIQRSSALSLRTSESLKYSMPFQLSSPTVSNPRPMTATQKPNRTLSNQKIEPGKMEHRKVAPINVFKLLGIKDHRKLDITNVVKINSFRGYLPSK